MPPVRMAKSNKCLYVFSILFGIPEFLFEFLDPTLVIHESQFALTRKSYTARLGSFCVCTPEEISSKFQCVNQNR